MSTLGTMVSRIRGDLNRGSDFDSRIKQAIESAIHFYRAQRFGFNMKRATTSTSDGEEYYALPSDFIEADTLRIRETSSYWSRMDEVAFSWMDDESNWQNFKTIPEKFAVQNRELRVYPIPDAAYLLKMSFIYELGDVSISASDGATNSWTTEGEELIRSHAVVDLLENYIGGQESVAQAQVVRGREQQVFAELKRRAEREQTSGRLQAWG